MELSGQHLETFVEKADLETLADQGNKTEATCMEGAASDHVVVLVATSVELIAVDDAAI